MKYASYHSGGLFGLEYHLKEGERIPMHNHKEFGDEHNIIVLMGAVRVYGEQFSIHLTQGAVFDFDGLKDHEIVATRDSHLLNLYIHGRPEHFKEGLVGETTS